MLLSSLSKLPSGARIYTHALAALTALLFSMPFILCLTLNAGFLGLANEPLAYRFFFSERIFAGETVAIGQGYLIGILHQIVYAVMHLFHSVSNSSLEVRLDLFALITNGVLSSFVCFIFLLATLSKRLRVVDMALLTLVTLMPLYGTVMIGFDYLMMADYFSLNIILLVATLFIFQQVLLGGKVLSRTLVIFLGIFVGLAMANKITMLVVTGVVLVPAVLAVSITMREILIRSVFAIAGLIGGFFAVHLAAYHGSFPKMIAASRIWWAFASNPGAQPDFLAHFRDMVVGYNYGYFLLFSIVILAVAITIIFSRKIVRREAGFVAIYCLAAYLISIYFIIKRPAGTTLFESTLFLFTLACVQFTVLAEWRPMRTLFVISYVAWISFAATTFSYSTVYGQIERSQTDSKVKWATFEKVLELAGNKPIEVIFPDNSYHHEGPFELLLKGAADFPSWDINYGQISIIDRYAPGMSFRHNSSQVRPEMPYANRRVLVWFDLDGTQPLEEKYLELKKILLQPGVQRSAPPGYSHLKMHIALIP
jgi:hypothetical protein